MSKLAVVTVAVGEKTFDMLDVAERFFKEYANKVEADFLIINEIKFSHIHSANLEKFQIYNLFDIYDRILYCDVDILISPRTPNIFKIVPETHIGAVYDCGDNNEKWRNELKNICQKCNMDNETLSTLNILLAKILRILLLLYDNHLSILREVVERLKRVNLG